MNACKTQLVVYSGANSTSVGSIYVYFLGKVVGSDPTKFVGRSRHNSGAGAVAGAELVAITK